MGTESIRVTAVFPVSPERIYRAWLDAREHGAMTGGDATVEPREGGAFTAWDGYISGWILQLEPNRRIVQSWRTTEFPEGSSDSRLEVELEPVDDGTRVTLIHAGLPEGQGSKYQTSWEDFYIEPMKRYFELELATVTVGDTTEGGSARVTKARAAKTARSPKRAQAKQARGAKPARSKEKRTAKTTRAKMKRGAKTTRVKRSRTARPGRRTRKHVTARRSPSRRAAARVSGRKAGTRPARKRAVRRGRAAATRGVRRRVRSTAKGRMARGRRR